ncbi:RagB/SusD family nutrient uptake outer membrane protein [Dyadobacter psychrotolerans]|uniref:RagB/SusD family nutrient uptake outer membrane protein n=1 Tax=Dyadobacter psychrotolerans TaxID=2541721 RepID=A0A4V2Z506_9BACT|nr:RagB/SusD family nutrient uptake outer membrane protein [Dyadobacter psychrotolerans]TDE18278.1 RagB/SusD family nutrient uptake outer membrane protein [Dyadobacter psychrotolerans]
MKKLTLYPILVTLLFLSACRDELDKNPLSSYVNENFWTSESNTLLALTGVYRGGIQMTAAPTTNAEFSPTDWWSYHGLIMMDVATDNAYDRRGESAAFNVLTNGNLTAVNANVNSYWTVSYARIARCNYFLENVSKAPLDADKLKRFIAETRFLRATQYFYLSQFFGSVPLVKTTLSLQQANTVFKAPKAEILSYALAELTAAAADLPAFASITSAERGRASKQAALAFLGRAQLGGGLYKEAAATYKTIIDLAQNTIEADYSGLFNGTNESSKEIIFATQYLKDQAPNAMSQHFFPAINGGWHLFNPLGSLVDSYEFTDGTPFSYTDPRYKPNDVGANRDPRLKLSVLYNLQTFQNQKYITHPDSAKSVDQLTTSKQATRTGFGIRKYGWEGLSGDLQNSGVDLPIIRYAEVLLSYLEAKLEAGDAINQALLDQTINAVRGRATVNIAKVTETDPSKLKVILRRERRNEFAFEGLRLWDLLRWKIAGEVLKGDFYGAAFPGAVNLRKKGTAVDPYGRWYVTTKNFRTGTDELWPVPQNEVSINPNLK